MKWHCKGQEFDQQFQPIYDRYKGRRIYIYGAGMVGRRTFLSINRMTDLEVAGFLDSDEKKQGKPYENLEVLSISDFYEREQNKISECLIIIGLNDDIGTEVKSQLMNSLPISEAQCILYGAFMRRDLSIIAAWKNNKIFVHSLSLIVSEKCTLNCKKCSIMLPYLSDAFFYDYEKICGWIDLAFEKIDMIGDFTVTGGEPLLNQNLPDILEYIVTKYNDRIGDCKIITNGTIVPPERLLDILKKYKIYVEISDYTKAVPGILERVNATLKALEEQGINHYFLSQAQWVDFGFEYVNNQMTDSQLREYFDYCRTKCRGYVQGKICYCINAGFAEKALEKELDKDNSLTLEYIGDTIEERRKIVEFDLGFNDKGYLNMCRHCNGTCEINTNYIKVGEQC